MSQGLTCSGELGVAIIARARRADVLASILSQWPDLTTLLLPKVDVSDYASDPTPTLEAATTSLQELYLPLRWGDCSQALNALLKAGKSTLRHLDFGSPSVTADALAQVPPETMSSLETVAPQLLSLEAVFTCWRNRVAYAPSNFLSTTLAALRDVEEVSLGDLGYAVSEILPVLQPLHNLQVLSIGQSNLHATHGPFDQLTSKAVLAFLDGAVALEYLSLPRQLEEIWTKDELKRVRAAAKEVDVRFELG